MGEIRNELGKDGSPNYSGGFLLLVDSFIVVRDDSDHFTNHTRVASSLTAVRESPG